MFWHNFWNMFLNTQQPFRVLQEGLQCFIFPDSASLRWEGFQIKVTGSLLAPPVGFYASVSARCARVPRVVFRRTRHDALAPSSYVRGQAAGNVWLTRGGCVRAFSHALLLAASVLSGFWIPQVSYVKLSVKLAQFTSVYNFLFERAQCPTQYFILRKLTYDVKSLYFL